MEQVLSSSKGEKNSKSRIFSLTLSKEKYFIFANFLIAFLIRFIFIPTNTVINGDGIYYATLGKRFVSGDISGGISGYWSPLYSVLVGISSLFFGDPEFAGRFVSVLAGSILVIPAFYLIHNFYGRMPAYIGTILIAIHPALIRSSGWVMTEAVYTLIFTTVILVGWYALRSGKALIFFITGLLWGAAYLTKPEALGFIGLLLILTMAAKFFRRNISFRRYAAGYLLLLTGFLVLFLPYVIFLYQKTGQWTISQKIMVNLPAFDYDKGLLNITDDGQITMQDRIWGDNYETEVPQPAPPTVSEVPSAPPFSWSKLQSDVNILGSKALSLFKKQLRDYIPAVLPYPFILIAIIGFFYKPWTRFRAARELYLFSFFLCMLIGYAFSAVELRYIYPLIPILIAWVAKGIVEFSDWTSKSLINLLRTRRQIKPLLVQICVLIIFAALLTPSIISQNEVKNFQNVPYEEKQAGLWIKNRTAGQAALVMSTNVTPAYYAGAKHLYLPDEEFLTVLEYAKRKKVNYLIYSLRRIKATSKAFPPDEKNVPPELRLVFEDEPSPNYRILVYQILY